MPTYRGKAAKLRICSSLNKKLVTVEEEHTQRNDLFKMFLGMHEEYSE